MQLQTVMASVRSGGRHELVDPSSFSMRPDGAPADDQESGAGLAREAVAVTAGAGAAYGLGTLMWRGTSFMRGHGCLLGLTSVALSAGSMALGAVAGWAGTQMAFAGVSMLHARNRGD